MNSESTTIETVVNWVRDADGNCIVFTGAGISTESGIPDFRSPGGVWAKSQPVMYHDFLASADARHEYWRQKSEAHTEIAAAAPNTGHRVLAKWEQSRKIQGVITQNIDGLHQIAGNERVLELHGTAREVACLDCDLRVETDPMVAEFRQSGKVPPCPQCGGRLKHATISFGQALPETVIEEAAEMSQRAALFLAIGSSLVVHPAAGLPELAKRSGARLVIINRDPTPLDSIADALLPESIGETLADIDAALEANPS
ncbi:MAG: Sir2 family NAD-dependent protein deacetylase [Pirellulales bacterium]|nr:Sir2 family NAD-dependent protein deacetylase [Pirellulales bacterium]